MSGQMETLPASSEASAPAGSKWGGGASIRLNPKQLAFFNRQLASMARLNMPLSKGLKIMAKEVTEPQFRALIESVQHDLEEGKTLEQALSRYPDSFGTIYIELLRAGESTGNLAVILEELTRYTETLNRVRTRLRDAILYPLVVSILTVMFVLCFFWFLIPNFTDIFVQAGLIKAHTDPANPMVVLDYSFPMKSTDPTQYAMDAPARFLFSTSFFLRNPLVIFFGLVLGGGGIAFAAVKIRQGWETYDEYMFNIPIFGNLIKMATLLKITRTMRDLLVNGVSMVNALKLTARVAGNNRIKRKLEEIRAAVEEGRSFSKSLAGDDVFPETMVWKLQMGEEKGIVEEALAEVANEFELDIETATTYLTSVLGPMMLLGMAFVIMVLMACLYPSLGAMGKGA